MAPITVDPGRVREFADADAFYAWLGEHHESERELWIRIFKKGSGRPSITPLEAIDVALCWGWIDAVRKGNDDVSFFQRYTPRGRKSVWSQINRDNVARLIAEGRMTEHGLLEVNRAKQDGRWDAAYSIRSQEAPEDLMAAIRAEPEALAMYEILTSQNRFALSFRVNAMKTPAGREKKIAGFVDMLKKGETIYPQKARKP